MEAILAAGHMGVIVQLADSCAESGEKQDEMMQCLLRVSFEKIFPLEIQKFSLWVLNQLTDLFFFNLFSPFCDCSWWYVLFSSLAGLWLMTAFASCPQAFHCAEPGSRHVTCLPLFMSLLTYETYYHSGTAEGSIQTQVNTYLKLLFKPKHFI